MSDTSAKDRVSLNKKSGDTQPSAPSGPAGSSPRPGLFGKRGGSSFVVEKVPIPHVIWLAAGALVLVSLASVAQAIAYRGSTSQLLRIITDANNNAGKNKKANFNAVDELGKVRHAVLLQAVLIGLVFLMLAYALTRTRSASGTRWALLIVAVYTTLPLNVARIGGDVPVLIQVFGVLAGAASIVALLAIFAVPQSQKYFRACKLASTPPELRGQARPGLGSLFKPRPRPAAGTSGLRGPAARSDRAARSAGASRSVPAEPAVAPKAKAKVRADSDAVAKGAELARSRAKAAAKSRRTT